MLAKGFTSDSGGWKTRLHSRGFFGNDPSALVYCPQVSEVQGETEAVAGKPRPSLLLLQVRPSLERESGG